MIEPGSAQRTRQQTRLLERYGPTAVVTGASSGIGRSCATYLAAAGFDLVVVARSGDALRRLATEAESTFGTDVRIVVADLATADGIETVISATAGCDVGLFVPAAGYGTSGALASNDPATEIDMVAVNCGAVLALTHAYANAMIARGRGGIVLFSSVVATQGVPRSANYAATKAYVHTLGEGLRHELGPHGVDVLISAPGPVESGFGDRAAMQMGGGMQPDDVARSTLHALGRRSIVRPGGISKLLGWSLAICPRRIRTAILGRIFRGFTSHQQSPADAVSG
jgi:short-subunit dehydrogenase